MPCFFAYIYKITCQKIVLGSSSRKRIAIGLLSLKPPPIHFRHKQIQSQETTSRNHTTNAIIFQ